MPGLGVEIGGRGLDALEDVAPGAERRGDVVDGLSPPPLVLAADDDAIQRVGERGSRLAVEDAEHEAEEDRVAVGRRLTAVVEQAFLTEHVDAARVTTPPVVLVGRRHHLVGAAHRRRDRGAGAEAAVGAADRALDVGRAEPVLVGVAGKQPGGQLPHLERLAAAARGSLRRGDRAPVSGGEPVVEAVGRRQLVGVDASDQVRGRVGAMAKGQGLHLRRDGVGEEGELRGDHVPAPEGLVGLDAEAVEGVGLEAGGDAAHGRGVRACGGAGSDRLPGALHAGLGDLDPPRGLPAVGVDDARELGAVGADVCRRVDLRARSRSAVVVGDERERVRSRAELGRACERRVEATGCSVDRDRLAVAPGGEPRLIEVPELDGRAVVLELGDPDLVGGGGGLVDEDAILRADRDRRGRRAARELRGSEGRRAGTGRVDLLDSVVAGVGDVGAARGINAQGKAESGGSGVELPRVVVARAELACLAAAHRSGGALLEAGRPPRLDVPAERADELCIGHLVQAVQGQRELLDAAVPGVAEDHVAGVRRVFRRHRDPDRLKVPNSAQLPAVVAAVGRVRGHAGRGGRAELELGHAGVDAPPERALELPGGAVHVDPPVGTVGDEDVPRLLVDGDPACAVGSELTGRRARHATLALRRRVGGIGGHVADLEAGAVRVRRRAGGLDHVEAPGADELARRRELLDAVVEGVDDVEVTLVGGSRPRLVHGDPVLCAREDPAGRICAARGNPSHVVVDLLGGEGSGCMGQRQREQCEEDQRDRGAQAVRLSIRGFIPAGADAIEGGLGCAHRVSSWS